MHFFRRREASRHYRTVQSELVQKPPDVVPTTYCYLEMDGKLVNLGKARGFVFDRCHAISKYRGDQSRPFVSEGQGRRGWSVQAFVNTRLGRVGFQRLSFLCQHTVGSMRWVMNHQILAERGESVSLTYHASHRFRGDQSCTLEGGGVRALCVPTTTTAQ